MQPSNTLDLTFVEATSEDRKSLREQVLAAWHGLRSRYSQSEGAEIYARYYGGAHERVSAAEPVTSLKSLMP